jgi:hypothetical protein
LNCDGREKIITETEKEVIDLSNCDKETKNGEINDKSKMEQSSVGGVTETEEHIDWGLRITGMTSAIKHFNDQVGLGQEDQQEPMVDHAYMEADEDSVCLMADSIEAVVLEEDSDSKMSGKDKTLQEENDDSDDDDMLLYNIASEMHDVNGKTIINWLGNKKERSGSSVVGLESSTVASGSFALTVGTSENMDSQLIPIGVARGSSEASSQQKNNDKKKEDKKVVKCSRQTKMDMKKGTKNIMRRSPRRFKDK